MGLPNLVKFVFLLTLQVAWVIDAIHLQTAEHQTFHNSNNTPELLWENSAVHVVTVDTRSNQTHHMAGPKGWDRYILNVGAGKQWVDFKTKMMIMRDWLETRPVKPSDILVFVDGDVMFGGCSADEFQDRFKRILKITGADVIFGAETQCNDYNGDCTRDYPAKYYDRVLSEFSLSKATMQKCTIDTDEKVRQCDLHASPTHCNGHHELKFLNSGLYAGHAVNMLHFLRTWLLVMDAGWNTESKVKLGKYDQAGATLLLEQYPDMVTLDYGTMLFSNLYGLQFQNNFENGKSELFTYKSDEKVWFNNVINRNMCFIHPNGNHSVLSFFERAFQ